MPHLHQMHMAFHKLCDALMVIQNVSEIGYEELTLCWLIV